MTCETISEPSLSINYKLYIHPNLIFCSPIIQAMASPEHTMKDRTKYPGFATNKIIPRILSKAHLNIFDFQRHM